MQGSPEMWCSFRVPTRTSGRSHLNAKSQDTTPPLGVVPGGKWGRDGNDGNVISIFTSASTFACTRSTCSLLGLGSSYVHTCVAVG